MKNILAENLLRFGVRNLSESDRKILIEAASAAGSYKTEIGLGKGATTIATMTFTIKGSTLMLTNNGALVCQWTINPDPKKDTDRNISGFISKKGTAAGSSMFNNQGQMVVSPTTTTSGAYGLDKSMLTALTETLNAQPANSPWKVLRKATNNTYSDSMLSRFTTWTSKLADNGVSQQIVAFSQFTFTGTDKQTYTIRPAVYYRIPYQDYIVYFTAPATIKTPEGGINDKTLQTAIQKSVSSLGKMNQAIISSGTTSLLIADMMKNIVPKMDALVKQL
jgi:hypothetical protein